VNQINSSPTVRALFIFVGICALILGLIGVFIPLLPTTPFLLIASFCFARSNSKFYGWLLNNRIFGTYVMDYIKEKSVKRKIKWTTIAILWTTISLSIILIKPPVWLIATLIAIAIGVSIHLLTLKDKV